MSKRTTITNGVRPFRYIFGLLSVFLLLNMIQELSAGTGTLLTFFISTILFFLLYISRWIQFDDEYIYRRYGKKEKAVSFLTIVSIKRTAAKVNGRRMWKVTFLDDEEKEKGFRFLEGNFQHGSTKEFIKKVEMVNPEVVVWEHPFFDHPPDKKK